MFGDDERTTGTHDEDTRDDANAGADASVSDDAGGSDSEEASEQELRQQLDKSERERKRLLAERTSVEQARRELEAERARLHPPETVATGTGADEARARLERDFSLVQEMGNPNIEITAEHVRAQARLQAAQAALLMQQVRESDLDRRLSDTEKDVRAEARKLVAEGKVSDVDIAVQFIKQRNQLRELSSKNDAADDEVETRRALRDAAPQTSVRGLSAAETATRMKESTFEEKMQSFANTPEGFAAKREFYQRVQSGKVKVIPG